MKYKVGDRVKIKSLDWYNENKDENGRVSCNHIYFCEGMTKYCGKVLTIMTISNQDIGSKQKYFMHETDYAWGFTDEMIEGLVEELLDNDIKEHQKICDEVLTIQGIEPIEAEMEQIIHCPEGYIFKDENGNVINATKIVLEKKKKEYPKTYEECRDYIESCCDEPFCADLIATGYKSKLIESFARLLICRDAYWKIAGDEMGLGKPWEPDWNNISNKYCIYFVGGYLWSKECQTRQCPFAFPTPEMRDAFKENFKELIEQCKELL